MHENKMLMSIVKFENKDEQYEVKIPNNCLEHVTSMLEMLKWEYTIDYNVDVVYLNTDIEANND